MRAPLRSLLISVGSGLQTTRNMKGNIRQQLQRRWNLPLSSKPTGIDLLIIFTVIGGVFDFLGAVLLLVVTSLSISWLGKLLAPRVVTVIFSVLAIISCLLLFSGITSLFLAYGLRNGRGWAWKWAVTSASIGLAASTILLGVGVGVVGLAANGLAIYYLTRPEIKAFFGKAAPMSSSRKPSMPETFCVHCGNRLSGKDKYCPSCGSKQ